MQKKSHGRKKEGGRGVRVMETGGYDIYVSDMLMIASTGGKEEGERKGRERKEREGGGV